MSSGVLTMHRSLQLVICHTGKCSLQRDTVNQSLNRGRRISLTCASSTALKRFRKVLAIRVPHMVSLEDSEFSRMHRQHKGVIESYTKANML